MKNVECVTGCIELVGLEVACFICRRLAEEIVIHIAIGPVSLQYASYDGGYGENDDVEEHRCQLQFWSARDVVVQEWALQMYNTLLLVTSTT